MNFLNLLTQTLFKASPSSFHEATASLALRNKSFPVPFSLRQSNAQHVPISVVAGTLVRMLLLWSHVRPLWCCPLLLAVGSCKACAHVYFAVDFDIYPVSSVLAETFFSVSGSVLIS